MELGELFHKWGDLRIEGYIQGKKVIVKKYSGKGVDQKFTLLPDDSNLFADGADTTRVVLRVTDEFGAIAPFPTTLSSLSWKAPPKSSATIRLPSWAELGRSGFAPRNRPVPCG